MDHVAWMGFPKCVRCKMYNKPADMVGDRCALCHAKRNG